MHGNRPFVGRKAELQVLRAALDESAAGNGSVVAVAGEAGIGKSRLVEEFARQAQGVNALVLRGCCYEDDWAPPYSPFAEAMEAYLRERAGEIGPAERVEVGRIVPSMDDAVPGEEPPRRSEERKYRLYQAVTRMLQGAAASTPVCLVLEDLHDADAGTLELLTHLGRNLQSTSLLLAVTYRSNEVSPEHPLSKTLAEIDRRSPTRRMVMSGLSLEEATELVATEAGVSVPGTMAKYAWIRTDGHPLFLRELARELAGVDAGAPAPSQQLPASLQELIGVRLAKLSHDCRQLLELVSVIGHEAPLGTLRQVSPLENGARSDALREAVAVGVLDERASAGGAIYVFHHVLFREALYMGLAASQRDELHVHVGHAIEAALGEYPGHAAELAEHLAHSMDQGDIRRATGYAELAAKHAATVFSWDDAVAWYERALELLDRVGSIEDVLRCDLLLALGKMLFNNGEIPRLEDVVAEEAFHLAVALEDSERAATATMLAIRSMVQRESYTALQTERGGVWALRALRYATHDDAARLRARFYAAVNRGRWGDSPQRP